MHRVHEINLAHKTACRFNQIGIVQLDPACYPSQGIANSHAALICTLKSSAATMGMRNADCTYMVRTAWVCLKSAALAHFSQSSNTNQAFIMEACNLLGVYCPCVGQGTRQMQSLRWSEPLGNTIRHEFGRVVTVASGVGADSNVHQHSVQG